MSANGGFRNFLWGLAAALLLAAGAWAVSIEHWRGGHEARYEVFEKRLERIENKLDALLER